VVDGRPKLGECRGAALLYSRLESYAKTSLRSRNRRFSFQYGDVDTLRLFVSFGLIVSPIWDEQVRWGLRKRKLRGGMRSGNSSLQVVDDKGKVCFSLALEHIPALHSCPLMVDTSSFLKHVRRGLPENAKIICHIEAARCNALGIIMLVYRYKLNSIQDYTHVNI